MSFLKVLQIKDYVTLLGTMFGTSVIILSILGLLNPSKYLNFIPFAAMMWAGAMSCDLLDGYVARKLNQANEIGREIDSLSDAVSFVVAPGVLILCASLNNEFDNFFDLPTEIVMIGVFVLVFMGIVRLAWFNVANVGEGYTGMTTPLTAGWLICFYLAHHFFRTLAGTGYYKTLLPLSQFFGDILSVTLFMIILGILNVSTFLKYGKNVQKRRGIWKKIIILFGILLVITVIVARGFMGTTIARFIGHLLTLTFLFAITGYYIYGFYNYLALKRRGDLKEN